MYLGAQSHGLYTRCLRFTSWITPVYARLAFGQWLALTEWDWLPTEHQHKVSRYFLLSILLVQALPGAHTSTPIHPVGAFTAHEQVITQAGFTLRDGDKTSCALIIWHRYDSEREEIMEQKRPLLVEFSFRYDAKKERYSAKSARNAYEAFKALAALDGWVDRRLENPTTKTRFVFELAGFR